METRQFFDVVCQTTRDMHGRNRAATTQHWDESQPCVTVVGMVC